ncbi:hypothetical protein GQ54DRAFT_114635 [Martensiomyces pterosporus]|nr:hypothetical protein GQ54DRAFT_114635 [Martensiomyces pterosporus]
MYTTSAAETRRLLGRKGDWWLWERHGRRSQQKIHAESSVFRPLLLRAFFFLSFSSFARQLPIFHLLYSRICKFRS